MKHKTVSLLKFRKLKIRLRMSKDRDLIGLLESLWLFVQSQAPRGDIGRFCDDDIAVALEWEGEPSELVRALVECQWLDVHSVHRLVVHDWPEHAPRWLVGNIKSHQKGWAEHDSAKQVAEQHAEHVTQQLAEQVAEQPAEGPASYTNTYTNTIRKKETPHVPPGGDFVSDSDSGEEPEPEPVTVAPRPPRRRQPVDAGPLPFSSPEFAQAWAEWLRYNQERRKPLPATTVRHQFGQLQAMGEAGAIKSIQTSIARNWQGLFPPTEQAAAPGSFRSAVAEAEKFKADKAAADREEWLAIKERVKADGEARRQKRAAQ